MDSDGSSDRMNLYERPFKLEEHGFVNGNVYILKSALRRRLTQIDPKWRTSEPEIMATAGDVVLMRGCLVLEGASRTAVGTGIIISTKKNDQTGEHEPLPPYEYARNLAKAYKTAASDLLPRLCMEYNIGAYLKAVPKTVRDAGQLAKWLDSLSPKKWYEDERNLHELSERAFTSGYIQNRNSVGLEEIKTLIAPKTWENYETGKDCWMDIKALSEAKQAAVKAAVAPAPEPAPAPDISTEDAKAMPGNGHERRIPPANGNGNYHYLTVDKVEYNGTLVIARTPANEGVKCGTKEAFKMLMPVPVITEQWTGTELVPEVYTLPTSVRLVYQRHSEIYSLSGIELPQEAV